MWWVWLVAGCSEEVKVPPPPLVHTGGPTTPSTPTAETGGTSPPLTWWTERVDGLVTAVRIAGELGEPLATTLRCRAWDDPRDEHLLHLEPSVRPSATLYGLLADTTYDCEIEAGGELATLSFVTDPLPDDLPVFEVSGPGSPSGAWVLMNASPRRDGAGQDLLVVDVEGRIRWYLPVVGGSPDVDATWTGDAFVYGGGFGVAPTRLGLDGAVLAQAAEGHWNHHAEPLPGGGLLALRESEANAGGEPWTGFAIVRLSPDLQDETLTWESQRGVDDGWLPPSTGQVDPYHANALEPLDDGGALVSLYQRGWIVRLKSDGSRMWTLGRGGDFELLEADGTPADPSRWFHQTHDPELAGDRLLVYDNGKEAVGVGRSRALELALDEAARTARIVWEWTEPDWFEPIWGDADRLPDGHVSITVAHCSSCQSGAGPTRVLEVDPATDEIVWQLAATSDAIGGYRSQRVDPCDLFPDRISCETAAPSTRQVAPTSAEARGGSP
ncbi:MAG: aryl-sulfate sulfotransferase [Alphaproteobacteria bacterium]|nr:aryl-sulfate sulfotransferase [Alphaproteobacteria bacterium]MCB9695719.1 aryl-sulfate sulfotransferase [Alphaproteobacteria bacterium]